MDVARMHGMTLEELLMANPQITDPMRVMPGQRICIPEHHMPEHPHMPGCPEHGCPEMPMMPGPHEGCYHMVMPGETLHSIARMYGVSEEMIMRYNPHITHPEMNLVGQRIFIPMM